MHQLPQAASADVERVSLEPEFLAEGVDVSFLDHQHVKQMQALGGEPKPELVENPLELVADVRLPDPKTEKGQFMISPPNWMDSLTF